MQNGDAGQIINGDAGQIIAPETRLDVMYFLDFCAEYLTNFVSVLTFMVVFELVDVGVFVVQATEPLNNAGFGDEYVVHGLRQYDGFFGKNTGTTPIVVSCSNRAFGPQSRLTR